jgi:hypothetical protein
VPPSLFRFTLLASELPVLLHDSVLTTSPRLLATPMAESSAYDSPTKVITVLHPFPPMGRGMALKSLKLLIQVASAGRCSDDRFVPTTLHDEKTIHPALYRTP